MELGCNHTEKRFIARPVHERSHTRITCRAYLVLHTRATITPHGVRTRKRYHTLLPVHFRQCHPSLSAARPTSPASSREVSESRIFTHRDIHADAPTCSPTGRRWPVRSAHEEDATSPEVVVRSGGLGRLESSGNGSSLSGYSSLSENSRGTNESRIEVHDFLEESTSGSGGDDEGSGGNLGDGPSEGRGEGKAGGDGESGGVLGGGNECDLPKGSQMGTLDAEDIAFLEECRELRETMLGVQDLHFGEQRQLHVCYESTPVVFGF